MARLSKNIMSLKLNKKFTGRTTAVVSSKFKKEVKEFIKTHEDVLKRLAKS